MYSDANVYKVKVAYLVKFSLIGVLVQLWYDLRFFKLVHVFVMLRNNSRSACSSLSHVFLTSLQTRNRNKYFKFQTT